MKRRVIKKVEKTMLVDKLCQLQQEIDEHLRFEGDLLVMLSTKNPDMKVLEHGSDTDFMHFIWTQVAILLRENEHLSLELKARKE